jgi:uracil-DNA glycosylase family 4
MGSLDADILAIGKFPGKDEDRIGLPMQGKAGQEAYKAITKVVGVRWAECFFTNVLGCSPPKGKSNVLVAWRQACTPRVDDLIRLIKPRIIVGMGLEAARFLAMDNKASMGSLANTAGEYRGIDCFFVTHPGEPLRQQTPATVRESQKRVTRDFQGLRDRCVELDLLQRQIE